jgi:hypothetical protein
MIHVPAWCISRCSRHGRDDTEESGTQSIRATSRFPSPRFRPASPFPSPTSYSPYTKTLSTLPVDTNTNKPSLAPVVTR